MIKKVYTNPDIFSIDVPLPDNPLKNLNCYIIRANDETLIIDTGFSRPECLEAMQNGLRELNVEWDKTSLFLTHLHADHVGLATILTKDKNCPIYMGKIDYDYFVRGYDGNYWIDTEESYEKQGLPHECTEALRNTNPARSFAPSGTFDAITMEDGDKITIGEFEFTTILVKGHTPGQMCLYLESEELMFTADHILFDITPNITSWLGIKDSLGDYIESLYSIRKFKVKTALPAHRKNEKNMYERIDEILAHHKIRLQEAYDIIQEEPNLNAYEIAARMKWSMRGKSWEEFPLTQRWFAVGETISHLDYLLLRGFIKRKDCEIFTYVVVRNDMKINSI